MKSRWRILLAVLAACVAFGAVATWKWSEKPREWGSFTNRAVVSSDGQYRAEHGAKKMDGYNVPMIQVDIYNHTTGVLMDSFVPARAMDFYGVCWEEGTHNLWIQSADIGIHCYVQQGSQWILDENAVRPVGIISKWD